jgi:hypothetical protein
VQIFSYNYILSFPFLPFLSLFLLYFLEEEERGDGERRMGSIAKS